MTDAPRLARVEAEEALAQALAACLLAELRAVTGRQEGRPGLRAARRERSFGAVPPPCAAEQGAR